MEGVGGKVSHSHNEVNGIVRLNHLGRHYELNMGLKIKNKDLSVRIKRKQCEVRFNSIPEIPAKLAEWKR